MGQTALEWLVEQMIERKYFAKDVPLSYTTLEHLVNQAKSMEKEQSHLYAEFAIRCDRKDMKILNFEDWIKLETFKSE